jgi:hypothetical protein
MQAERKETVCCAVEMFDSFQDLREEQRPWLLDSDNKAVLVHRSRASAALSLNECQSFLKSRGDATVQ